MTVTVEGVNEVRVAEPGVRDLEGSDFADDLYVSARHLTINGGGGDDRIYTSGGGVVHGDAGDDTFFIGAGDDSVYGDEGDDTFFLGDGVDTVVFDGAFDSYDLQALGQGKGSAGALKIWSGKDHNTLSGVETVMFADGAFDVATMTFRPDEALLIA